LKEFNTICKADVMLVVEDDISFSCGVVTFLSDESVKIDVRNTNETKYLERDAAIASCCLGVPSRNGEDPQHEYLPMIAPIMSKGLVFDIVGDSDRAEAKLSPNNVLCKLGNRPSADVGPFRDEMLHTLSTSSPNQILLVEPDTTQKVIDMVFSLDTRREPNSLARLFKFLVCSPLLLQISHLLAGLIVTYSTRNDENDSLHLNRIELLPLGEFIPLDKGKPNTSTTVSALTQNRELQRQFVDECVTFLDYADARNDIEQGLSYIRESDRIGDPHSRHIMINGRYLAFLQAMIDIVNCALADITTETNERSAPEDECSIVCLPARGALGAIHKFQIDTITNLFCYHSTAAEYRVRGSLGDPDQENWTAVMIEGIGMEPQLPEMTNLLGYMVKYLGLRKNWRHMLGVVRSSQALGTFLIDQATKTKVNAARSLTMEDLLVTTRWGMSTYTDIFDQIFRYCSAKVPGNPRDDFVAKFPGSARKTGSFHDVLEGWIAAEWDTFSCTKTSYDRLNSLMISKRWCYRYVTGPVHQVSCIEKFGCPISVHRMATLPYRLLRGDISSWEKDRLADLSASEQLWGALSCFLSPAAFCYLRGYCLLSHGERINSLMASIALPSASESLDTSFQSDSSFGDRKPLMHSHIARASLSVRGDFFSNIPTSKEFSHSSKFVDTFRQDVGYLEDAPIVISPEKNAGISAPEKVLSMWSELIQTAEERGMDISMLQLVQDILCRCQYPCEVDEIELFCEFVGSVLDQSFLDLPTKSDLLLRGALYALLKIFTEMEEYDLKLFMSRFNVALPLKLGARLESFLVGIVHCSQATQPLEAQSESLNLMLKVLLFACDCKRNSSSLARMACHQLASTSDVFWRACCCVSWLVDNKVNLTSFENDTFLEETLSQLLQLATLLLESSDSKKAIVKELKRRQEGWADERSCQSDVDLMLQLIGDSLPKLPPEIVRNAIRLSAIHFVVFDLSARLYLPFFYKGLQESTESNTLRVMCGFTLQLLKSKRNQLLIYQKLWNSGAFAIIIQKLINCENLLEMNGPIHVLVYAYLTPTGGDYHSKVVRAVDYIFGNSKEYKPPKSGFYRLTIKNGLTEHNRAAFYSEVRDERAVIQARLRTFATDVEKAAFFRLLTVAPNRA
jgi:hypothetical protein